MGSAQVGEQPDDAVPPTPEEAELLAEPYIPWHPHDLSPERRAIWNPRACERELAEFRLGRHKRIAELGMKLRDQT